MRRFYLIGAVFHVVLLLSFGEAFAIQRGGSSEDGQLISRIVDRIGTRIGAQYNLYPTDREAAFKLRKDRKGLVTSAWNEYVVGGPETQLDGSPVVYYTNSKASSYINVVPTGTSSPLAKYRQVVNVWIGRGEESSLETQKPLGWPSLGAENIGWNYKFVTDDRGARQLVNDRQYSYTAREEWKDAALGDARGKIHTYHVTGEYLQPKGYYETRLRRSYFGEIYSVDWREVHAYCIIPVPGQASVIVEVEAVSRNWRDDRPSLQLPYLTESHASNLLAMIADAIEAELKGAAPDVPVEAAPSSDKPSEAQISPDPAPTVAEARINAIEAFDANPSFNGNRTITDMAPRELAERVRTKRVGAVADQTSQLLLRAELTGKGLVVWNLTSTLSENRPLDPLTNEPRELREAERIRDGHLEGLHAPDTQEIGGKHYAFALYTSPARFDSNEPGSGTPDERRRIGGTEVRDVSIQVTFQPEGATGPVQRKHQIILARPPVLLVHGTFDNPQNCWETSAQDTPSQPDRGEVSMAEYLRNCGHQVFLVDYSNSNGAITWDAVKTGRVTDKSSFLDNATVLWTENGIKKALTEFRSEGIAATRVNVIGHSMGGLIPRLWASDFYNKGRYRRADNFNRGDIHRLITIGTTHYGSDLSTLHYALNQVFSEEGFPEIVTTTAHRALEGLLVWGGNIGASKAVMSQMPESTPLQRIGSTRVPSHAIIGVATVPSLRDFGGSYLTGWTWTWRLFSYQPGTLKKLLQHHGMGEKADEILYEGRQSLSWMSGTEEVMLALKDQVYLAMRARSLLFGDQPNDMVVRVESQAGGLPLQYTSQFNHVLHSFEPRYREIQQACAALLAGPQWKFCEDGFPVAGQEMLDVIASSPRQNAVERRRAAEAGGLMPSHAEAISSVAVARDEWILFRPVNPDATRLIERGFATKDMFVKGKSSDWGPQRGYVCRDQRFSKLVGQEETIEKFGAKVEECLLDQRATAVALRIVIGDREYEVRVIKGESDPRRAIVLCGKNDSGEDTWYEWQNDGDHFKYENELKEWNGILLTRETTEPMEVLADRFGGVAVTADYDLLAFGIRGPPAEPQWDDEMGGVTETQKESIRQINYAVRLRARYLQGNVSHHGPEVQYHDSPGVDFPITIFSPEGDIYSVPEGPQGQKDREIKKWFHKIKTLGYSTGSNPAWKWGPYRPDEFPEYGWNPNDDNIRSLPEELNPDNPFDSDQ